MSLFLSFVYKFYRCILLSLLLIFLSAVLGTSNLWAQKADTKILEFSNVADLARNPEILLKPKDENQFLNFLEQRDTNPASKIEPLKRPNFSIAAARRRLSQRSDELRIGLILPEKRLETLVELMQYAAQMAFFDSGRKDARLFFYDIGDDEKQARNIIQQASRDGVDIVLGPLFSESVTKIAPFAGADGLPMIVFSNAETVAERGVYVFGLTPSQQTKQIIHYALGRKTKKIAVFTPESEYGRLVADSAVKLLDETGDGLNYLTFYDEASRDLSQQVRQFTHYDYRKLQLTTHKKEVAAALSSGNSKEMKKVVRTVLKNVSKNLRNHYKTLPARNVLRAEQKRLEDVDTITPPPFDAVLIAASSSQILRTIISLFSFYDVSTQNTNIYGLQLWDEMNALKSDPALRGARHVTIDSPRYQDFRKRYRALFGKTPPTLISLVYDATILALTAAGDEGKIDPTSLHISRGYSGVGSHFRFAENGLVERLYGIKMINGKKSRVVQTAPNSFAKTP